MVRWLVEQQHLVVTHVGYTRRLIRGGGTWWLRACGSCSRILPKPIRIFHPPEKESTGSEASDGAKPMDESTWGGEVRARSGGGQGEIRGRSGRGQGEVRARSGGSPPCRHGARWWMRPPSPADSAAAPSRRATSASPPAGVQPAPPARPRMPRRPPPAARPRRILRRAPPAVCGCHRARRGTPAEREVVTWWLHGGYMVVAHTCRRKATLMSADDL